MMHQRACHLKGHEGICHPLMLTNILKPLLFQPTQWAFRFQVLPRYDLAERWPAMPVRTGAHSWTAKAGPGVGPTPQEGKSPQKRALGFIVKLCRKGCNCSVKIFESREGIFPSVLGRKLNISTASTSLKSVKPNFSLGQTKMLFNSDCMKKIKKPNINKKNPTKKNPARLVGLL